MLGEMVAGNKKQDEIILTQQASPVINGERGTHPRHGVGAKSQMLLWHQYLEVLRKELGPDAAAAAAAAAACMSTEGRKRTRKEQTSKCTIALPHARCCFVL